MGRHLRMRGSIEVRLVDSLFICHDRMAVTMIDNIVNVSEANGVAKTSSMAVAEPLLGLSSAEVSERIAAGKVNVNTDLKSKSVKELIIENLCTLFNLINLVLAILVILTGSIKNLSFLCICRAQYGNWHRPVLAFGVYGR